MGKIMATFYDAIMYPLEQHKFKKIRASLLKQAHGHVLEIGAGTGINFSFYSSEVTKVDAIEPDFSMRKKAKKKATTKIKLHDAQAESLPFEDNTFDSAVSTLVLCSVSDPELAIQELKRVVKPNGKCLIFEHVKVENPIISKVQDVLTPVWKHMADGCHLNRETDILIEEANFYVVKKHTHYQQIFRVLEVINQK
ncbi:Methyltransferase domain-containing protein [Pelagirhabdus alkalitolerans]|uniref:Methyltransferase domain-containing protein n=1 Tax=Pelagirhabdus alkalitolerans TaxID=1612202 RepID=A0A1G6H5Q4_9BACI|nr:class I SAM-dependent methyltransferase [Pelagirhabdus alkalitolerans]SDB89592.1 Methyltransferase domain-containing protein [Pelagirhabdus alkalitolerans]